MSRVAVIEGVFETGQQLPLGSRIGFAVMALGIAADLIAHVDSGVGHHHGGVTGAELSAHLIVFVGMALVLIGVVLDGVRSGRRHGGNAPKGR